MSEVVLSVREVAELLGLSTSGVKKRIAQGKLNCEKTTNERNRPMYLIPLSSLDIEFQRKYYKLHPPVAPLNPVKTEVESILKGKIIEWLDLLSEQQQAIILGQIAKML